LEGVVDREGVSEAYHDVGVRAGVSLAGEQQSVTPQVGLHRPLEGVLREGGTNFGRVQKSSKLCFNSVLLEDPYTLRLLSHSWEDENLHLKGKMKEQQKKNFDNKRNKALDDDVTMFSKKSRNLQGELGHKS